MFKYAPGRFVQPSKIITANVYQKEERDNEGRPTGGNVLRVAIDLDVKESSRNVIYSEPMPSLAAAEAFIASIPCSSK